MCPMCRLSYKAPWGAASLVAAAAVFIASPSLAQQALPTIDVGGARPRAAVGPRPRAGARVAAPSPILAQRPAAEPVDLLSQRDAPRVASAIPVSVPATVATFSRAQIDKSVNAFTVMGMSKYMPSLLYASFTRAFPPAV